MSQEQTVNSAGQASKKTTTVGWVAFGLAILGFIFAVIPGLSFIAWVVILAAFIVSIVALAKKGSKKAVPTVSLIVSIISGVVAIIVSVVTVLAAVSGAASQAIDDTTTSQDEIQAGIGQPVLTSDGAQLVIQSVECGLPTFEGAYQTSTAIGQFCVVKFTLSNPSNEPIIAFTNDFGGLVGGTDVEADKGIGTGGFGPDSSMSIELNPGLSIEGTAVIDIPAGATFDAVTFGGMGRDEIAIAAH
ncbi:MAG: hypothetical protein ACOYBP_02580 [Microbacteriaceae bacterium]